MFLRRRSTPPELPNATTFRRDQDDLLRKQLVALEAVSARHSAHITIMWQAPVWVWPPRPFS
ncbi:hypothetical protein [Paractinoplanes maris]|uniref:hypothetical protein n=1 Tax=Paractinoplanes maris TaxID=1734446 RepID=UPI00202158B8|nr:hypothetical protein [Actinoplanes maris]